ncbi:RNA-binding S4 domain-containing protein [Zhihengliuella sp.]|uniref:RNA-binding S4 domain-containing protein n=1 Tax=Zhihengliuella sp. TaxID=1954483 RepID=UPI0028123B87|nr:RNA-binding S4 domain-containing protein [Zhihengliuella sp.]
MSEQVRIDAWLWAVRVYKTRSAATTACRAGHVKLDGRPVKAAQTVAPGAQIRVRQNGVDRFLEVTRPIAKRVGAQVAQSCYIDHTPERPRVAVPQVPVRDRGAGRPTKKDRRELDRLRQSLDL